MRKDASVLLPLMFLGLATVCAANERTTNSIQMEFVDIPAGSFLMGQDEGGDWDEAPAHQITISRPFKIGGSEVTLEQYRKFRPGHEAALAGKAVQVSWHDAVAFCEWLSKREGKPYRLPTEAEWEYVCRAGTTGKFWSGDKPPGDPQAPNPWGVRGLHDSVLEWCVDWHGPYIAANQTDPAGPSGGMTKVLRGGKPDNDEKVKNEKNRQPDDYHGSSNRAGMPPSFGQFRTSPADPKSPSAHQAGIGFRVVQAPAIATVPMPEVVPFVRQCLKKGGDEAKQGPAANKPYFRKRYLLPVPPDNSPDADIAAVGLPPSFRHHNHSPGLAVCPNGDVLLIIYTSYAEYEPGVSLMAARLRFGADQWDMPDPVFDCPDANDHAPMLWTDWTAGGRLYFFWGSPQLAMRGYPFQWMTSDDNGATWSGVNFPNFVGDIGPHSRQPINTAVRARNGTLFVASDAIGGSSVLWATSDEGKTWRDTGGRSAGRHTTYCLLKDGSLLGMGGKVTNIRGCMPKAVSQDEGKTWTVTPTPFPALANNQRPSLLRLQSGRLFFASDFQSRDGKQPDGINQKGSFVALSDDDGETWRIKRIPVAQPHEVDNRAPTLGYSAAAQAPNGTIHLITTMNKPCLHFELNEAWILSDADSQAGDGDLMPSRTRSVAGVTEHVQTRSNGKVEATWSAGLGDDGRYLLEGTETWFFPHGQKHYQAKYHLGQKVGTETLWRADGGIEWEWRHHEDGTSHWIQYWGNGLKKSESTWRNRHAEGAATRWDSNGKLFSETTFLKGCR